MPDLDVDLFVIGGGSGGVRAARIAAGYGAKVMLAEEFRMGGTCVIRGCVPKKLLVYASRFPDAFHDAAGFGWTLPEPSFDWSKLVAAKEKEVTRLEGIYTRTQENAGVTVVKSRAVLEDAHTVHLLADGRRVRAKTILIAGGGYIALEFAGLFAGLGSEVTVIYRGDNVLRGFDEDLRQILTATYKEHGIRFIFNDVIGKIESNLQVVESTSQVDESALELSVTTRKGEQLIVDQVMMAIGRSPNTAGLGLEAAGVALDKIGAVKVDDSSRSNVPHIYAVGDVTNRVNLTPVAIREGHAFADSVFGGKPWQTDHSLIPTAVFTTPEIGTVGLTEAEAIEKFAVIDIYKTSFRPMKATLSGSTDRTLMKIVVDGETDRVLGVHIFSEDAGEMAQLLGIALKAGATKAQFDATMAVHPTAAEELVTLRTRTTRHERAVAAT